jgi:hypothetical protein
MKISWSEIIAFVIGIIVKVVFDLVDDWIAQRVKRFVIQRAKTRYASSKTPLPSKGFHCFRIGNLEIPAMPIIGSPRTAFQLNEVIVRFSPVFHHQQDGYPAELLSAQSHLVDQCKKRYRLSKTSEENIVPRLDSITQGPEMAGDKRGLLYVNLSLTTFDMYFATNKSLDYEVIPKQGLFSRFTSNETIRDAYVVPPYDDLSQSLLANPPAVHIVVISRCLSQEPKDQLLVRRRSQDVSFYRGYHQVSATGYMSTAHHDAEQIPNPFYTAVMESRQEIADSLSTTPEEFKLIGLSLNWEDFLPVFYGYIETGRSVHELLGDFRRDSYEGSLLAIPFNPESVLTHIAKEKWEPQSALAAVATLLTFYPRSEVETVARTLPAKNVYDFFENPA